MRFCIEWCQFQIPYLFQEIAEHSSSPEYGCTATFLYSQIENFTEITYFEHISFVSRQKAFVYMFIFIQTVHKSCWEEIPKNYTNRLQSVGLLIGISLVLNQLTSVCVAIQIYCIMYHQYHHHCVNLPQCVQILYLVYHTVWSENNVHSYGNSLHPMPGVEVYMRA